jgi:hypothetical protein
MDQQTEARHLGRIRRRISTLHQTCDRLWAAGGDDRPRQVAARELETLQVEHEALTGHRWYGKREWEADAWRRKATA